MMARLVAGALLSAAAGAAGWRANALSGRGAVAATGVGTGIAVGSSWPGLVILGTFFISSSALSRRGKPDGIAEKGSRRDERQVLANGAVSAVGALVGRRIHPTLAVSLAAGALSAATADTWATELGAGSRQVPRLIVSGRAVQHGASGGITLRGSLASFGGAVMVGAVTSLVIGATCGWSRAAAVGPGVVVAGLAGSLVDSLLGDLIQERRECPVCKAPTEARWHHCGAETLRTGGLRGFDNDLVNLACTVVGGLTVLPFACGVTSSRPR